MSKELREQSFFLFADAKLRREVVGNCSNALNRL